jgi:hypothetical protein
LAGRVPFLQGDKISVIPLNARSLFRLKGFITMNYSTTQVRHIVDGVWGPWGKAQDKPEPRDSEATPGTGFLRIEFIKQENGQWSEEIGPGVVSISFLGESIGWLQARASCQDINNAPAPLPNPPKPRTGAAVTTRQLLDPNPNKPRECTVPEGTTVVIVADAPEYGKAKVRIWNRKPGAVSCSDTLVVNEDDIRPLGNRPAAVQLPSPTPTPDLILSGLKKGRSTPVKG